MKFYFVGTEYAVSIGGKNDDTEMFKIMLKYDPNLIRVDIIGYYLAKIGLFKLARKFEV